MDMDVDVSRALDTIAEEVIGNSSKLEDPIILKINNDDNEVSESTVITLKAALYYWSELHEWDTRLFKISRYMIKYGDTFFKKQAKNKKWEFIHPRQVAAAVVNKDDATDVLGWQIRLKVKEAKSGLGVQVGSKTDDSEIVSSDDIVRFSIADDLSEIAPFGESVLQSAYKAHKQKQLLEDAILIYRISRAPERRAFYVDVGTMPPARVKKYLEQIKTELKQKKIPTNIDGNSTIESVYNPQSMSEDFFFAVKPGGAGTKVEMLPGGQNLGELSDLEYFQSKVWEGLKIPDSYMRKKEGAINSDGKVGVAYIQELRFALYIKRLQAYIEKTLTHEFREFLKDSNILIDDSIFKLALPEPTNFGIYRQQEVDSALLSQIGNADTIPYLSKRFVLKRYLHLTEEEILLNEGMLKEEAKDKLKALYHPAEMDDAAGAGGIGALPGGELEAPILGDEGSAEPSVAKPIPQEVPGAKPK